MAITLSAVNALAAGDLTVSAADATSGGATTIAYGAGDTVSTSVHPQGLPERAHQGQRPLGWHRRHHRRPGLVRHLHRQRRLGVQRARLPAHLCCTRTWEQQGACPTTSTQCARIPAGGTLTVQVAGHGGVPASGATSVAVNLIAANPSAGGWLAVGPGDAPPFANNLLYETGQVVANCEIIKLSTDGKINIYSSAAVDVILNVQGWFGDAAETTGSLFTPHNGQRLLDTRLSTRTGQCPTSTTQCTPLPDFGTRTVQVTGRAGVPTTGVRAVVVNMIVVANGSGWITASRGDATPTGDGEIFYSAGETRTANVIIPSQPTAGSASTSATGGANVILDVQGWFADQTQTFAYTYDPTGLRRTKTAPNNTVTRYNWDRSGALPLLLSETTNGIVTRYFYGPGGQPYAQQVGTNPIQYLHADQIGSIRAITNNTGTTLATLTYDTHGTPTASTGTATSRFGYAGQYTDPETGYQYLRARYYDPTTAQFLTRDPLEATTGDAYGYAWNNPLNYTDPTGEIPSAGLAIAVIAGGAFDLGMQAAYNLGYGCDALDDIDWNSVKRSAAIGGLTYGGGKAIQAIKALRAAPSRPASGFLNEGREFLDDGLRMGSDSPSLRTDIVLSGRSWWRPCEVADGSAKQRPPASEGRILPH